MSKMGISVISSYRGGYNFEAVGLSRSLVASFFPDMPARISGLGLSGIQKKVIEQHRQDFSTDTTMLPIGGFYRYRYSGETHAFDGVLIHMLQRAVATDDYGLYKVYADSLRAMRPMNLRDLLDFQPHNRQSVPLEEVESITAIRRRFVRLVCH